MEGMPNEIFQNILIHLPYQQIWALRRLNVRWRLNCEKAFACKLLAFNSQMSLINLHLLILNSRGSPWFHLIGSEDTHISNVIEDKETIPLFVKSVDFANKVVEFSLSPKSNVLKDNTLSLERRSFLSRFEWCLKGLFRPSIPTAKSNNETSVFTLVSVDTDLIGDQTDPSKKNEISLSTFEMQMCYIINQDLASQEEPQTLINIEIKRIRMSYSYLFSILFNADMHTHRISVFDPHKIAHIKTKSLGSDLVWDEKYWSFDLVLHWLLEGSKDDVKYIIEFLKEHERHSVNRKARSLKEKKYRYYSIASE